MDFGTSPYCNGDDTDENGFFIIEAQYPGNYRVVIWEPGWIPEFYTNAPNYWSATLVPVDGSEETGGIDFELEPS